MVEEITGSGHINSLIHESSPYLLQHARNPVNWHSWGKKALAEALKEDKLLLISIGYSACHWCHVMEHESFEDVSVANIMNRHFVPIKVDREERPDIDQIYMDAAMIVTGQGGWPLNAIALPDGRPVYAGTYFPKDQWIKVLEYFANMYHTQRGQLEEQAEKISKGIQGMDMLPRQSGPLEITPDDLDQAFESMLPTIDFKLGGKQGAPKFPMPNNWDFLLRYYYHSENRQALDAVTITLTEMAKGGIYDHLGGGFARYSTDPLWKEPHFEKMLYDNAQLVSLYSDAYKVTKEPMFREVVFQTLGFVEREMTNEEGAFYSALDADSEGEEGKFYTWKAEDLKAILGDHYRAFEIYYNLEEFGNWEENKNILYRTASETKIAQQAGFTSVKELKQVIDAGKKKLLEAREQRERPDLDDKSLTAWNALMLKGYVDAYRTFHKKRFLEAALKNAYFLKAHAIKEDYRLTRNYKAGKSSINGFLDDYSFTIQAFIALYEATFDESWLLEANELMQYAVRHFHDRGTSMFFYTNNLDDPLIARKLEMSDNVIPASNSVMANNLFVLGHYFVNDQYLGLSRQMLQNILGQVKENPFYFTNWLSLLSRFIYEPYEVVITGKGAVKLRGRMDDHYLPGAIFAGGKTEGTLKLLKDKINDGQTTIYVCRNKTCSQPVTRARDALQQINGKKAAARFDN